jgi:hypothetical protein
MGDDKHFLDMTMDDLKTGMPTEPAPGAATPAAKGTATPDAKVVFENALGVGAGDDVIDIPARPAFDALVAATGGPEKLKENAQALREAIALTGTPYEELAEGLSPEEEHTEIVSTLAEWREILANPMKAQAMLQKIYAHPMQEPGLSYFRGRGSPELNEAIAKLWQATQGEAPTGRRKSKGDGWIK